MKQVKVEGQEDQVEQEEQVNVQEQVGKKEQGTQELKEVEYEDQETSKVLEGPKSPVPAEGGSG